MASLKFKQLLVLSNSEKSGNLFQFKPTLNLVTAKDNNVGKSTLAKLLFWSLGCEPSFDTKWTNLDCKTIVRFQVSEMHYEAMRYKDTIVLKEGESKEGESIYYKYSKITGEFSRKMARILSFKVLINNRKGELETPPTAYYFLPFYIDQKRSWTKAWDNFEKLEQYSDWRKTIIQYHTGLLTPRHFELESEKYQKVVLQKELINGIEQINVALEVVDSYIPKIRTATTPNSDKFLKMTEEIKEDLSKLSREQEEVLDELSKAESERAYLVHQKKISESIILQLEKDYQFSTENIEGDEIECPLCGTVHENSVVNRASILVDKQQGERQLEDISRSLANVDKIISKNKEKLDIIRSNISLINSKYTLKDENEIRSDFNDIIENIAGNSLKEKVIETKKAKVEEESDIAKSIKTIKKEQKKEISKETSDLIISNFNDNFIKYIKILGAEGINISSIQSPLDYNKVIKEGGAAENARAMLAYYSAIYTLISQHGNDAISAIVIDTPNQHEQSHTNYDKIIKLILDNFPKNAQVILCAMENEQLKPYKDKAHLITLDENQILDKKKFPAIKKEFEELEEIE